MQKLICWVEESYIRTHARTHARTQTDVRCRSLEIETELVSDIKNLHWMPVETLWCGGAVYVGVQGIVLIPLHQT